MSVCGERSPWISREDERSLFRFTSRGQPRSFSGDCWLGPATSPPQAHRSLFDGNVILRSSVCPHFGGDFEFRATEAILECKWHGWKFDARTGECRNHTIGTKLRTYQFEIVDGMIFVKCE